MTTKPTTLPEWATDPGAVLVTPSAGKQAVGYAEGEMPPVGEQNWLHRHTYEWLAWLAEQKFQVSATTGFNFVGTDWAIGSFGEIESITDPGDGVSWAVPLDVPEGSSWSSARFRVKPAGTNGQLTCSIVRYVDGAVDSVIGSATSTTGSAWEDVTVTATIENTTNSRLLAVIASPVGETEAATKRYVSLIELTP